MPLKNIKYIINERWLYENIRSNLVNIVIGIDVSLIVNLFTNPEKNCFIWVSIILYTSSLTFLFLALAIREDIENEKDKDFIDLGTNIIQRWQAFIKKHKNKFNKYRAYLFIFAVLLISGVCFTLIGNKHNNNTLLNYSRQTIRQSKIELDSSKVIN